MQHEHTEHVAAPPDAVYAVICRGDQPAEFRAADSLPRARLAKVVWRSMPAMKVTNSTARRCSCPTMPHEGSSGAGPTATTVGCRSTRMVKVRGSRCSSTRRTLRRAITMSRRRSTPFACSSSHEV